MTKDKTWYLCDPEKNTKCGKVTCKYNYKSPWYRKSNGCTRTSDAEYAQTDPKTGKPILAPIYIRRIP